MIPYLLTTLLVANIFPPPKGYVNDFAGIIESPWNRRLDSLAVELKEKTGTEMAVVTLRDIEGFMSIEEAAVKLYEEWGIGEKGVDKGFLILVVLRSRKIRIEVGYGLEETLTDGFVGSVIRNRIVPLFRQGKYGEGLYLGALTLAKRIAKEESVELHAPRVKTRGNRQGDLFVLLLLMFFFFFPWIVGGRRKKGIRWVFGPFGGWGGGFGSGGGFGGFGGGASGGGGATGGW